MALARLIRWAMVDSGTRNAAAISLVVRPPTARSVSGMADPGVSDGWQHMNMRISVSSRASSSSPGTGPAGVASDHEAASASRRRRASSLRYWSVIRRAATRISHPSGWSGVPSAGQWVAAASSASWTASSAAAKSPERRATAPRACGASSRSRLSVLMARLISASLTSRGLTSRGPGR